LQRFTASDGAELAYTDEGAGRPLLLLHGLMAHGGFFRLQRDLTADFRLIAIDFRGHGASPMGAGTATVDRLAADVNELPRRWIWTARSASAGRLAPRSCGACLPGRRGSGSRAA
jgi:pimeloyl-ACP methyl ester carboxylesterase